MHKAFLLLNTLNGNCECIWTSSQERGGRKERKTHIVAIAHICPCVQMIVRMRVCVVYRERTNHCDNFLARLCLFLPHVLLGRKQCNIMSGKMSMGARFFVVV